MGYVEYVEHCLEPRNLVVKLLLAFRERAVFGPKAVLIDHAGLVEVVEFVDLPGELPVFVFKGTQEIGFFRDRGVGLLQMCRDFIVREIKVPNLFLEYGFQVTERNLVAALVAGVFRVV
ncbi:MAG: hypothetical protein ACYDHY_14500 [Acidiferrobacterales bacterium]